MVIALSPIPNLTTERGVRLLTSFLLSVGAGIVAGLILYFVGKWLDGKFGDD